MKRALLAAISAAALVSPAVAQAPGPKADNLEKLSAFRSTGTVEPVIPP